jgi:hypothetical protein
MTTAAYIRRETGVSMVINAVLTLAFFLIVFGRSGPVPVWGVGAYVFDFVPQGFMIGLMGSLVPGALAGKARRAGKVAALGVASPWPANLVLLPALCAGRWPGWRCRALCSPCWAGAIAMGAAWRQSWCGGASGRDGHAVACARHWRKAHPALI